jgi:hypothetical protein
VDQKYIAEVLQPGETSKQATEVTLEAATKMGLIYKDSKKRYVLGENLNSLLSTEEYRDLIAGKLLSELPAELGKDNDLFALYATWSIIKSDQYSSMDDTEKFVQFRKSVTYPDFEGSFFNTTKYAAWKRWAVFLGLGFVYGKEREYVPCPVNRICNIQKTIFKSSKRLRAREFFTGLGKICPELDGGKNFNRFLKEASLEHNQVSCAVSMALRLIHDEGKIWLEQIPDAEIWTLWEDKAHKLTKFSHLNLFPPEE